jgi:hypothetical protein
MLAQLAPVLAQLGGSDDPRFHHNPAPFITIFLIGFALGILGHLVPSKVLVAVGVLMVGGSVFAYFIIAIGFH